MDDPVRFQEALKLTIQTLEWKARRLYERFNPDMASVAYWYQKEPHVSFPKLLRLEQRIKAKLDIS